MKTLAAILVVASSPALLHAQEVDFRRDIEPIFKSRCYKCHGEKKQKGELRLDSPKSIRTGGENGSVVVPGKPKESPLYKLVSLPPEHDDIMPAKGDTLTREQIALIRKWIEQGANYGGAVVQPKVRKRPPVAKADPAAVQKLKDIGGMASVLGADTNYLSISFRASAKKTKDTHLDLLAPLAKQLVWLDIGGTRVTDAGAPKLAGLKALERLHLEKTAVTDAGLEHLKGLAELRYLNLYGTGVTDAGLVHLKGLKKLQKLFLWRTKVTDAGEANLAKALPGLRINRSNKWKIIPLAAKPINAKCSFTGKPLNPKFTSGFDGQVIGFCCGKCKARFDKNPAKGIKKVKEYKPVPKPINTACPFTGAQLTPKFTSVFDGQVIGFCCGKCMARFDKNPAKGIKKVKEFKK